ncbi:hypothetical protein [Tahibacter amnicola]|uniref:Uncharacterized protein n=1 Tax=Tahibacter amnicola TaxID=2976241 RepID=A0ABY6BMM5_9GAMM|nr:hypothetical protein [Tahibacter amnicola]UXI69821.1 hypothetical protein N4264_09405 [Tahibacter amnicola]
MAARPLSAAIAFRRLSDTSDKGRVVKKYLVVFLGILVIMACGLAQAAGISCEPAGNGYACEAWPRGADYRYEWNVAGGVRIAAHPSRSAPRLALSCTGRHQAHVTVTVVAPAGYIETATQPLTSCRAGASPETAGSVANAMSLLASKLMR